MAFNEKEKEIISYGLQSGKSQEEVKQALVRYRTGAISPQPTQTTQEKPITTEPNALERVLTGIKKKGQEIADIQSSQDLNNTQKVAETAGTMFSGISSTAYNALPEIARNGLDKIAGGIGKGFQYITDKISDNKFLQEAMSGDPNDTKSLMTALDIASNAGIISSEILGAKGVVKPLAKVESGIINTVDKIKTGVSNTVKELTTDTEKLATYPTSIADAISEKITRIDPKVKNVLDTASIEKFDNYVKAGEDALKNPRVLTPLEQAGDLVNSKILPAIKEDLKNIGSQKSKSLSSIGKTQVPNATLDVIKFIKDSTKGLKLTVEENKLIKQAISELELGTSPTISTLDKAVDLLQSTLFEKSAGVSIPTTSRVKSIINQSIGKLNATVKKVAKDTLKSDEYSVLNDAYSTKVKLFQNLNKLLGEEGKKGGSLLKRFFSPQDSGTKKLFAQIKDLYGVDLAEDATIAKFVMESLGDSRASSLLQMVPLSKGGVVTKALSLAEQKLTRPIQKARKIVESSSRNFKKNKK